ncbi:hypothetical protein D3C81_1659650 [compost metagenome]
MNSSIPEYFRRSANAPVISAGVMMAKVSWNDTQRNSGMPGSRLCAVSTVTPFRNRASRLPIYWLIPASPLVPKAMV